MWAWSVPSGPASDPLWCCNEDFSGQLRQEHQYKNGQGGATWAHKDSHCEGRTMNNNCHVNQVPILMLIINYNSYHGNDTN